MQTSSNIKHHSYDADTKKLRILFHSGSTYTYHDVPQFVYDELKKAKSLGSHLHKHIKEKYKFTKV